MMETSLEFVIIVELSIIQKNHITKYEKGIFAAESVIQNIVQKYFLKKNKTHTEQDIHRKKGQKEKKQGLY